MNTIKIEENSGSVVIYEDSSGKVELRASSEGETVWATQDQMAKIFETQRPAITKHLRNIFKTSELSHDSVSSKMELTAADGKGYQTRVYNLDAIIAVGYRVNSKKATKFRIWANTVLREYILKGIAVNEGRIEKLHEKGIVDLKEKLAFIQNIMRRREIDRGEVDSLLSVIADYANSWLLLKKYDDGEMVARKTSAKKRDDSFKGILWAIYQTYDGKELYQSLEEKASHLLCFVIKDYPFFDGNKRSGALLFILFLEQNGILRGADGQRKISENALVAIALLVAESDPSEKEAMVTLVTHLIS